LHLRAKRRHEVSDEVVRERTLLWRAVDEHADRGPHAFIHIDDENLVVVSDEDCAPRIERQHSSDFYRYDGLVHSGTLSRRIITLKSEQRPKGESETARRSRNASFQTPSFFKAPVAFELL